jgi:hypothetical protein
VTLPTATKAVILHARYIKDGEQTFMLETTLLQVGGAPHGDYLKGISNISAITKMLVFREKPVYLFPSSKGQYKFVD